MDEDEPRRATTLDDMCSFSDNGTFQHFLVTSDDTSERREATEEDLLKDAIRFEHAYVHDSRWLSGRSHNHSCTTTCVKK